MAVPFQVQNLTSQQADGNILLSWNGSLGATSYTIQRSTDNVNFVTLASTAGVQYTDPFPGVGTQFFYLIIAVNISGNAPPSTSVSAIASPPGELALGELRQRCQERADRVNSAFVTNQEWNFRIRLAMYELYDLLIVTYEDYGMYEPGVFINTTGTPAIQRFALPNGVSNYLGNVLNGVSGPPAPAFYKMLGVDLGVNTSNNAFVTLHKFNWIDRNSYVYPNSTSTIFGVYNMRFRVMANSLFIIPTPANVQQLRLWYAPRLPALLNDTDLTTIGNTGWLDYVISRTARYALAKEQDPDPNILKSLDDEIAMLRARILEAGSNRDIGAPDTISNTRRDPVYSGYNRDGGSGGGW